MKSFMSALMYSVWCSNAWYMACCACLHVRVFVGEFFLPLRMSANDGGDSASVLVVSSVGGLVCEFVGVGVKDEESVVIGDGRRLGLVGVEWGRWGGWFFWLFGRGIFDWGPL